MERVPIIAMTAHAIGDYKKLCLEAGMDDYIAKPLLRKDLFAIVNKWIGGTAIHEMPVSDLNTEELTAKAYIVPGLGDAGDLCFGSKLQE